jgi:hypothetical protein
MQMKMLEKAYYLVAGDTSNVDFQRLEREEINEKNFKKKLENYEEYLEDQEIENPMCQHNQEMISALSQFIKRNKKLVHLNLEQTSMSEFMLYHLCKCLTRT